MKNSNKTSKPRKNFRKQMKKAHKSSGTKSKIDLKRIEEIFSARLPQIFMYDQEGKCTFASVAGSQALGLSPSQTIGKTWQELGFPSELNEPFKIQIKNIFESGQPVTIENTDNSINGDDECQYILNPIKRNDGTVEAVECIVENSKTLKHLDMTLKKGDEKYKRFLESGLTGFARTRVSDGKLLEVNDYLVGLLGYEDRETCLNEYFESEHYVDPDARQRMLTELKEKGRARNLEFPITRRDGSTIWVSYSGVLYPKEDEIEFVVTDITDRKHAEDAFRKAHERAVTAERIANMGSWEWDLVTDNITFSENSLRIYGIDPKNYDGKFLTVMQLIHPDDQKIVETKIQNMIANKKPEQFEYRVITPSGVEKVLSGTNQMYFDNEGNLTRLVGMIQDITERKLAEEELHKHREHLEELVEERTVELKREIEERALTEKRIEHLNDILRAIRNVNQLITQEKDVEKLLKGTCKNLIETRGFNSAWIALLDGSGKFSTTVQAHLGKKFSTFTKQLKGGKLPICARGALKRSEVVIIENPSKICGKCSLCEKYVSSPRMAMRLEYGGRVYGILSISCPSELKSDDEEQALFKEVAGDIAFALHNIEVEEEHTKAKLEFERVFNISWDMISIAGFDGYFKRLNPAFEKTLGYSNEELMAKPFIDFVHPEDKEATIAEVGKIAEGIDTLRFDNRYLCKDGSYKWLSWTAIPAVDEELMYCVSRDITEQMKAEGKLKESEEKYRNLFESSEVGMYRTTLDGSKVLAVNRKVSEITGFTKEEILSNPGFIRWGNSADRDEMVRKLRDDGYVRGYEVRIKAAGDEIKTFLLSGTLMPEKGWFEGSIIDITERKQAEDELKKTFNELTNSNKELEQFAYIASHDLQEPLRKISSFTDLLKEHLKDSTDEKIEKYMYYILNSTKRMQQLIIDLLTYSRVTSRARPFEQTNFESILNNALDNIQYAIKDSGSKVSHDPLPTLKADRVQMVQIFQNLISNSIKFRSGKIPEIHVSAIESDSDWVFSVKDNGIGIEPQFKDRIFEIFQRLHTRAEYPGTGIGLALCKKIVNRHNGNIWVKSEKGKGSAFYFTISKNVSLDQQDQEVET